MHNNFGELMMLNFKKVEIKDYDLFKKYMNTESEYSCETTFVNLLTWQCTYNNMFAVCDEQLIIKSGLENEQVYRLPYGNDFEKGMELIRSNCGNQYPTFWVQEGKRFEEFKEHFGDKCTLIEKRDSFDYIYLQSDLAQLSGKKYHSKRNHISAFSKTHDWHYEPITNDNINDVHICAEKWYAENSYKNDSYLLCEKRGLDTILDNRESLAVKGGAIYVGDMVVSFTLGSPLNSTIFDIHIEKALKEYATAYTVINNEFAKRELGDYKYINREDDMGLEGLRKAKLSYKPNILLPKYYCILENSDE